MSAEDVSTLVADAALQRRLTHCLVGPSRFDRLARTLYATDASLYQIVPAGVVCPRTVGDVVEAVLASDAYDTPLIARGAGTGLAGGAVGAGIQVDCSRHLHRMGPIDVTAKTVDVGPGVVLDELNHHANQLGLGFAPDVATSSRATIGGMIANNSCGAYSVQHGRTVDHIEQLSVVLADGSICTFSLDEHDLDDRARTIERELAAIRDEYFDEIQARFPKVLRSNGGYGLDRLGDRGSRACAVRLLCGSEGTLGIIVGAKLRLTPLPSFRALVVLQFDDLHAALRVTPDCLRHQPSAVELVDKMIIDAGRSQPAIAKGCTFLSGDPEALLVVEFQAESEDAIRDKVSALVSDPTISTMADNLVDLYDASDRESVWRLRKAGLGLMMSRPGDKQPYAFVEDSAVDPSRLAEYIERFERILAAHEVPAGYYAHASVGCIHVRPVLNMKNAVDIQKMKAIADSVADLAIEFGGTITGEHGDGIVRSCWLERLYGAKILSAFKKIKQLFDPKGILNPGKIVDPLPMADNLRFGESFEQQNVKTLTLFGPHGSMAGLNNMCSGVGQCRQRLVGTMCPSYVATGDEIHSTRGRANALRSALSNRGLLHGLSDDALDEAMDLCLSCKACKAECPTGVDMAKLKAEFLHQRNLARGASLRSRFLADLPQKLALASKWPRISNWLASTAYAGDYLHDRIGLDRRFSSPRLALQTFRAWYARHRQQHPNKGPARGRVAYFADCWTNYLLPEVGQASVKLLEAVGYQVQAPHVACCGRTAISAGLLCDAKQRLSDNVRILASIVDNVDAIVGTEPSCLLTLADELPSLVDSNLARKIAAMAIPIETFLLRVMREQPGELQFKHQENAIQLHNHCHLKSSPYAQDTVSFLQQCFGSRATELNTGCCGMAGSFGQEVEHYDVARAIGNDRLFPAVRERGTATIAITGFSCRQQIQHHCEVDARHVVEIAADAIH